MSQKINEEIQILVNKYKFGDYNEVLNKCSSLLKKNSNKPLGLYRYNLLANLTKLPNIALGGINKINLKLLKLINTNGFASISYFKY